jgi:hypothetical protein
VGEKGSGKEDEIKKRFFFIYSLTGLPITTTTITTTTTIATRLYSRGAGAVRREAKSPNHTIAKSVDSTLYPFFHACKQSWLQARS